MPYQMQCICWNDVKSNDNSNVQLSNISGHVIVHFISLSPRPMETVTPIRVPLVAWAALAATLTMATAVEVRIVETKCLIYRLIYLLVHSHSTFPLTLFFHLALYSLSLSLSLSLSKPLSLLLSFFLFWFIVVCSPSLLFLIRFFLSQYCYIRGKGFLEIIQCIEFLKFGLALVYYLFFWAVPSFYWTFLFNTIGFLHCLCSVTAINIASLRLLFPTICMCSSIL